MSSIDEIPTAPICFHDLDIARDRLTFRCVPVRLWRNRNKNDNAEAVLITMDSLRGIGTGHGIKLVSNLHL